jgi:hypothetical protein
MRSITTPRPQHSLRGIDFISPHSLDECAYRLGRLDDRRRVPFVPQTRICVRCLNENTWSFSINETLPAPVRVYGYLNRLHDASTYISGEVIISYRRLCRDVVMGGALLIGLGLVVHVLVALVYGLCFGLFLWRYLRGIAAERSRLTRLIGDTLSY